MNRNRPQTRRLCCVVALLICGAVGVGEAANRAIGTAGGTRADATAPGRALASGPIKPGGNLRPMDVEPGIPQPPENLLRLPIRFVDPAGRPEAALRAVVDGDPATSVEIAAGSSLELLVVGAHRWMDRLTIVLHGGPCEVGVLDWHGAPTRVGTVAETGAQTAQLDFDAIPANAVVLRVPPGAGTTRLSEIGAYFIQTDPDRAGEGGGRENSTYEAVVEYVIKDHGGRSEIDGPGFKNALGSNWTKYSWAGDRVWETDFTSKNNDYVDKADITYEHAHGTSDWDWDYWANVRAIYLSNDDHDDCCVVPGDADGTWGNKELEWIGIGSCAVPGTDDRKWANVMDHLHLLLGWKTVKSCTTNLGSRWVNNMTGSGVGHAGWRVLPSWEDAADATDSSGHTTRTLAETTSMINDYLWGQGTVQPDPSVDRTFYCYDHNVTPHAAAPGRAPEARTAPAASTIPAGGEVVRLRAGSPFGFPVVYDAGLQRLLPTTMTVYQTSTPVVNETYVRNMADRICSVLHRMCAPGAPVAPDGYGDLCMTVGSDELRVSMETGAFTLVDGARWLTGAATSLPDSNQAKGLATSLLSALGRVPADASGTALSWAQVSTIDRVNGDLVDWSNCNVQVDYARSLGGYPVVGPGARDMVTFGSSSYLDRWSEGGWRQANPSGSATLLSLNQILTLLATRGSDCTIDGIEMPIDSIHVQGVHAGYYELDRWTHQATMEPTYIIDAAVYGNGNAQPENSRFCVNAIHFPPAGSFDNPPEGSWFNEGTPIQFRASATGGTPPYTFSWSSNVDGPLGSGQNLTVPLSVAWRGNTPGDPGDVEPHEITLQVMDATGAGMRVVRHIGVRSLTDFADHDVGDVTFTVTDQAILGYTDANHTQGSGFVYGGQDLLYIGSPWYGTSTTYVDNRDYAADPQQEWKVSLNPDGHLLFGNREVSDQDGLAIFDDSAVTGSHGIRVDQRSFAYAQATPERPEQRGLILYYTLHKPQGPPESAYFGLFLDLDIVDGLSNEGLVDTQNGYISMWHAASQTYVGLALLKPSTAANMTLVNNETYVWPQQYMLDRDKYLFLTGGDPAHVVHQSDQARDWSVVVSTGPFMVQQEAPWIAFALAAGSSQDELRATLSALRDRFGEMANPSGVVDAGSIPAATRLLGIAPNPIGPTSAVRFDLARAGRVSVRVYSSLGTLITTLVDRELNPGRHAVPWDGRSTLGNRVASGVYYVRFDAGGTRAVRKAMVVR